MNNSDLSWNSDAPQGQCWKCPDCESWATLGSNAANHAEMCVHGMPKLEPIPFQRSPDEFKFLREMIQLANKWDNISFKSSLNDPYMKAAQDAIRGCGYDILQKLWECGIIEDKAGRFGPYP